jgi:hypothetical protein
MAIELRVPLTKPIRIDDLLSIAKKLDLNYGVMDEYWRLQPDAQGDTMFFYDASAPARGFEADVSQDQVLLTLNLPTSLNDIESFYAFGLELAKETDSVLELDGQPLDELQAQSNIVMDYRSSKASLDMLERMCEKEDIDFITIPGIFHPLHANSAQVKKMAGEKGYFEKWMAELQNIHAFYAVPMHFSHSHLSDSVCIYALSADTPMLMPSRKESGLKQNKDIPVYVMSSLDHLVDYDTFLQQVKPQSEYDAMNNLYYVSSDQVKKLNEMHGISVEELLNKPEGTA